MNFFHSKKTQKSNRPRTSQRPLFLSPPFIDASLVDGSFKKIVVLPKYVDEDEWLAVNVFEFFNYLNMFYGTVTDFCTSTNCPTMSAGPNYEPYIWTDQNQKKNTKLPAPTYIDYVMTWIQNLVNDENVFPTKAGREFPKEFSVIVKSIFKQCFRVFAHIYYQHYEQILHLREEKQFNSLFAHFISFAKEFNLLPDKKELAPLEELITYMEINGRIS
ncbi:maintenance of ploidy protein mob2 [Gigaspora rosea]|uniref:Maintenance of ploidy protein mob2 n=1 Tax=Gigaspora rosea TaxID=44941 RepID=A0A397U6R3_9GLOM|nr:maintenance of ploidy protein mob2 [Gigaspora rosea]